MDVKGYYDTYWAPEGYNPDSPPPPNLRKLLDAYASPGMDCLDFGCGPGTTGIWLRGRVRSYVGLDVSRTAVDSAKARGVDARVLEDGAPLPVDEESFDITVCTEVLEHLFAPQSALVEILRALRGGGLLIVTVPNVAHWRNRADLLVGRWNPRGDDLSSKEPWRDPHLRFFTRGMLERLLVSTGFDLLHTGAHSNARILSSVPGVRHLGRREEPTKLSTMAARGLPRLFGHRLYAVTVKRPGA